MSRLRRSPEIFVEGEPRSHYTVQGDIPSVGEHILRIVGEALQVEGVEFRVTAFEGLDGSLMFAPRVKFGIRLNGKDL